MKKLEAELTEIINRIPKDLIVWEREIKKFNKKNRSIKDIRKSFEYSRDHSYYLGKLIAYIYVLGKINKQAKIKSSVFKYFKQRKKLK